MPLSLSSSERTSAILRVSGCAFSPLAPPGSCVEVDWHARVPVADRCYLVRCDGRIVLRRYRPGPPRLVALEGDDGPTIVPPFDLVGRVLKIIRPL